MLIWFFVSQEAGRGTKFYILLCPPMVRAITDAIGIYGGCPASRSEELSCWVYVLAVVEMEHAITLIVASHVRVRSHHKTSRLSLFIC